MRLLIFLLIAAAALSFSAEAISVVSDYLANDTLELTAGASKIYSIRLQNPSEQEIAILVSYDKTFVKVIDYREIYTVKPKETGYRILFNVTAPKKHGTYKIGYTVSEVEPSGGGGLPIRLKINRNFNLKVIKDPNNLYKDDYIGIGYAVILLLIATVLFKKIARKKRHNRKVIK